MLKHVTQRIALEISWTTELNNSDKCCRRLKAGGADAQIEVKVLSTIS